MGAGVTVTTPPYNPQYRPEKVHPTMPILLKRLEDVIIAGETYQHFYQTLRAEVEQAIYEVSTHSTPPAVALQRLAISLQSLPKHHPVATILAAERVRYDYTSKRSILERERKRARRAGLPPNWINNHVLEGDYKAEGEKYRQMMAQRILDEEQEINDQILSWATNQDAIPNQLEAELQAKYETLPPEMKADYEKAIKELQQKRLSTNPHQEPK